MADWTAELEDVIFTLVKTKTYAELATKYPDISYATEEKSNKKTKFPNIYLRVISMSEEGKDLHGITINAVLTSVQVDVTANTTKTDAKTVICTVQDALVDMGFNIISLPIFTKEDDVHRAILRARRIIGSGDTL